MSHQFPQHDPDAILDYRISWAVWLDGDTIDTSTWILPDGTVLDSDAHTHTSTITTVWVRGATSGVYTVTNRITTAGGRSDDRTVNIPVRHR